MMPRFNHNLTLTLFLAIVFSLSLAGRIAWIASSQLDIAHQALGLGDTRHAIMAFERSIHAYIPYLPSREEAKKEMHETLRLTESEGNLVLSLEGWRRLRAALISSRSIFGQPDRELLDVANSQIARLASLTDKQGKMTPADIQQEATELLHKYPKDVSAFWGVMQFVFLSLWVALTCYLIWIWPERAMNQRVSLISGSIAAWLCWLAALYLAG